MSHLEALIVIDAQNEFSARGQRPVRQHDAVLAVIQDRVAQARRGARPIAWVRHHNRPDESPAFVPGTWGAEFSPGCGPLAGHGPETAFTKDVYGAFTGAPLAAWLRERGVDTVRVVGFYTHGCVATTAREALMQGFTVVLDPAATAACDLEHQALGRQSADDVRRSAILHLVGMGATIAP